MNMLLLVFKLDNPMANQIKVESYQPIRKRVWRLALDKIAIA